MVRFQVKSIYCIKSFHENDINLCTDSKHMKKRYPSLAADGSLNKKPPMDNHNHADTMSRSQSATAGWVTRKDTESLGKSFTLGKVRINPAPVKSSDISECCFRCISAENLMK